MGEKYRYFLKNIGLMTISNFSGKILSFLLVPLYTSVLSAEEYGIYDVYTTTVFLLIPLLSVCIADAVMRFTMDKEQDPGQVFSVALRFYARACICIGLLVFLNGRFEIIPILDVYPGLFLTYYCLGLLSDIVMQFVRGLERVADLAIAGFLNSGITVLLNVLLLVVFPVGIKGYFAATCAAYGVTILFLFARIEGWRYLKRIRGKHLLVKEMVEYSKPLIANQISWWINNVSDRYIVTWLCGVSANGIYSVAYKIPSILQVFQTIFNQAWILSAVKEMENREDTMYSAVYRIYNCGMVIICSVLIILIRFLAGILFAKDFYQAWQYAPFLLVSGVFGSLSALCGGIFTAAKSTKTIAETTTAGACINTVLNIILVFFMGPVGAAIATLVSYMIVWAARMNAVQKMVSMEIWLHRDMLSYMLLIVQAGLMYFYGGNVACYTVEMIISLAIICVYAGDIKQMGLRIQSLLKKG